VATDAAGAFTAQPDNLRQANAELLAEIARRKKYEDGTARLNSQMKQQIDELESLSYAISHDVRGPLRHIEGFARALADKHPCTTGHPAHRYIERIRSSVHHLTDIVEGLLAFSRASRTEMQARALRPRTGWSPKCWKNSRRTWNTAASK
jgi:signal transduction histidine kinase